MNNHPSLTTCRAPLFSQLSSCVISMQPCWYTGPVIVWTTLPFVPTILSINFCNYTENTFFLAFTDTCLYLSAKHKFLKDRNYFLLILYLKHTTQCLEHKWESNKNFLNRWVNEWIKEWIGVMIRIVRYVGLIILLWNFSCIINQASRNEFSFQCFLFHNLDSLRVLDSHKNCLSSIYSYLPNFEHSTECFWN